MVTRRCPRLARGSSLTSSRRPHSARALGTLGQLSICRAASLVLSLEEGVISSQGRQAGRFSMYRQTTKHFFCLLYSEVPAPAALPAHSRAPEISLLQ